MDNHQMGLYSPQFEHDNCGIGAVVSIKGIKTHQIVSDALKIVENLEHRAGKDALGETGDGVGILLQINSVRSCLYQLDYLLQSLQILQVHNALHSAFNETEV